MRTPPLAAAAYVAPFAIFFAIYLPAAGHGFISDDFGWILHNRLRTAADLWRIVTTDNGFYRPAVSLTFSLNHLVFGLTPLGYGLTNVALAAACGLAVFVLCRSLALARGAAAFAAAAWLLNLHGINMAILWISGRTVLLATLASVLCTAALLRGRHRTAMLLLAVALFSREETVLLPVVAAIWLYGLPPTGNRQRVPLRRWALSSSLLTVAYLAARATTEAMTPLSAPSYYRFTVSPETLLANTLEYADRTMTLAAAALLLAAVLLRPSRHLFDDRIRGIALCGLAWLGGFLGLALLLPVRSSLYACLPSVGVSVAAAAVAERLWALSTDVHRRRALFAAVLVPVLLLPVYHGRTRRWVAIAEFSTRTLADLQRLAGGLPNDSRVVIVDDRSKRANMASAFATLLHDAYLLTTDRFVDFWIEPPIPGTTAADRPCEDCVDLWLDVRDGRLVPAPREAFPLQPGS